MACGHPGKVLTAEREAYVAVTLRRDGSKLTAPDAVTQSLRPPPRPSKRCGPQAILTQRPVCVRLYRCTSTIGPVARGGASLPSRRSVSATMEIQVFDPSQSWSVVERRLPHWSQAGTVCFITIRMWDSIPRDVLQRLWRERADWLRRHGISSSDPAWQSKVDQLPKPQRLEFKRFIWGRWESHLDECHGSCACVIHTWRRLSPTACNTSTLIGTS